jgi:bifunctional UDP-N-acetylglucosamine pyrophosphorylase/glucosamine-1-phosphate N-acetyltransferase
MREAVVEALGAMGEGVEWVVQEEPLGTGHAVMAAGGAVEGRDENVWVLSGDVPGVSPRTLSAVAGEHERTGASCTLLTMELDDARRYGRVLRDGTGRVRGIVEFADATEEERRVRELNSGTYAFRSRDLFAALPRLSNANAQREYYLTDAVRLMLEDGLAVSAVRVGDPRECMGGDTPEALEAIRAAWGRA